MVEDVELWRAHMSLEHMGLEHMGLEHMDLAAHSAGAALAMLCAARYPHRIRRLVLITPNPSALGLRATPEDRLAAARLRAGEPWFAQAFPAFRAWLAGERSPTTCSCRSPTAAGTPPPEPTRTPSRTRPTTRRAGAASPRAPSPRTRPGPPRPP